MEVDEEKHNFIEIDQVLQPKTYGCGMVTLRRFFILLRNIFSKYHSILVCFLISLMALIEQYLVYNVGIIPSRFYKVLGEKNWSEFWNQVLYATLLIVAICFVLSCKKYLTNTFYVLSREILTDKLHSLYFRSSKFYMLNTLKYDFTDNPDQRITQDVDKFCKQFSSVVNPFIIAPFTISYYSYQCYKTTGWIGPVGIFAIFILSVLFNKLLMKPILNLVIKQEKCEGDFRFKHMHVRTYAESIALQGSDYSEMTRCDMKLMTLIKTQQSLYLRQFPLDTAVNLFSYMGSIVSYLILAYPIFSGMYDNLTPPKLSELISKNAFVSIYLISCFSSLINLTTNLSEIGGLTHRVFDLLDVMTTNKYSSFTNHKDSKILLEKRNGDNQDAVIEFEDVTFCIPRRNKPLLKNLNLKINIGQNLLITGNSGSGKTSLFRVIRGLWRIQNGQLTLRMPFKPSNMFMLPQQPLMTDGTLMEQIVYPLDLPKDISLEDKDINLVISYLKFVGLDHLLEKTGLFDKVDWNWYDVLSPGESQRLSFVRLFCHKPKIALLDEATSALGLEHEAKMYTKCKELNITVISIGHRLSLEQFHNSFLHLNGENGWVFSCEPLSSTCTEHL